MNLPYSEIGPGTKLPDKGKFHPSIYTRNDLDEICGDCQFVNNCDLKNRLKNHADCPYNKQNPDITDLD